MSEQWIHQNENILKTMEQLTSKQDRDRLELINSMLRPRVAGVDPEPQLRVEVIGQ